MDSLLSLMCLMKVYTEWSYTVRKIKYRQVTVSYLDVPASVEISQYETQEESVKWNIHLSEMAGKCHRMYLLIILVESAGHSKGIFSLRT